MAAILLSASACGSNKNNEAASASPTASTAASPAGSTAPTGTTASASPSGSPAAHTSHWTYEGESGPSHWAEMGTANAACANGTEQSPINIEIAQVKPNTALEGVKINYSPTAFTVINNGHTIQANANVESNNTIVVEGKTYKLAQFHFHLPSEHQFNGQSFDMELHLVHKSDSGELAVIGVMLKAGKEQAALSELWSKLPKTETKEGVALAQPINLASLLPADKTSFRYNGSLTTPPCSQSVHWVVLEQPVEVSAAQIEAFKAIFPHNARPVQDLKGRTVQTDKK